MARVIGMRKSSFTGNDGELVKGTTFYLTYPLTGDGAAGQGADRAFLTEAKLSNSPVIPKIGDDVEIVYNRYGKASEFRAVGK